MSVHVHGIRHHGPGCARALRAALEQLAPDLLLIEGPPEASETLALLSDPLLVPPIALLVHAVDDPQRASFYPFAEFSPEWQALRYGAERSLPMRFIDLPCAHTLARPEPDGLAAPAEADSGEGESAPQAADESGREALREDPIGLLAEAAGYRDHEQWWDVQIEQRRDAAGMFEAINEAMAALREREPPLSLHEQRREAHMRGAIRSAQKEGFQRVAVVCGAYHAPALAKLGAAKHDAELLRGLPKTKVACTWIPWTSARLAFRSGYGAGVDSPGWYAHLFRYGEQAPTVWATLAARLLREQDLDASAANVIETIRLASALASLRELPMAGLRELRDAIEAVLSGGEQARLGLIRTRLEIGEALGSVPEHAGQVPLMRDFERSLKRLRLKLSAEPTPLELDLRKEFDRERSQLLHRLRALSVPWGSLQASGRGAGTFRESWLLCWKPELAVDLIASNLHGNGIESAASSALRERGQSGSLPELTRCVELALLAALPSALSALLEQLGQRSAGSSDICAQMEALAPLAQVVRYGDVRATSVELVMPLLETLLERIVVGLQPACTQVDDAASTTLLAGISSAHSACLLLDREALKQDWLAALTQLLDNQAVHAQIRGRACRMLLEQRALDDQELLRRASLALSASVDPGEAARWIEGLVAGEALLLVHQESLIAMLDGWISKLGSELFQAQLPLLRRAFSGLAPAERRLFAQRIKRLGVRDRTELEPRRVEGELLDPARVRRVLPVLAHLLGVHHE